MFQKKVNFYGIKPHAQPFNLILDTEKGINGLQRQLETRDQELADERSKRQILEKHFEKKTQHRLMNDLAKQRTRVGAYFQSFIF